ncbi:MAG: GGDEF domain-containing protein [Longicatena sp.]
MITIIYSNLFPFLILLMFLALVVYNPIFNKKQKSYFIASALTFLFMLIVISVDFLSHNLWNIWYIRKITSFINFAVCPLVPLFLYKIAIAKKSSSTLYIPLIVNVIICFISIWNGCVFNISTSNTYDRGSLFFLPFLTTILYMCILIWYTGHQRLKGRLIERLLLTSIITLLVFGMVMEIIFGYFFLSWVAASLSLPMYYLLLNINHSILDPLTSAYNRSVYMKDLDRMHTHKSCIIALLDINDFKTINDTYGHDAGDRYLITFTNIMHKHVPSCSLYRIGGDEFVVLSKKDNLEKVNEGILQARVEMNKIHLDFSFGIGKYLPQISIFEFINQIDALMYENKKADKANKNKV